MELAQLCCQLRAMKLQQLQLEPLEARRLELSQAALEVALLSEPNVLLSKASLQGFEDSEELWRGWPFAFLTFEIELKTGSWARAESYSLQFQVSRWIPTSTTQGRESLKLTSISREKRGRGLADFSSLPLECMNPTSERPKMSEEDDAASSSYHCDCFHCAPWLYDFVGALDSDPFLTHWELCKERNRRSARNPRRPRRVPVASSCLL